MRWDSYENFNQHHEDSVDGAWGRPRGGGRCKFGGTLLPWQIPPPKRPWSTSLLHGPLIHLLSRSLSLLPTCPPSLVLSPLRLPNPHPRTPGWQSLRPGAAGPPPDPASALSGATSTPHALCQQ